MGAPTCCKGDHHPLLHQPISPSFSLQDISWGHTRRCLTLLFTYIHDVAGIKRPSLGMGRSVPPKSGCKVSSSLCHWARMEAFVEGYTCVPLF